MPKSKTAITETNFNKKHNMQTTKFNDYKKKKTVEIFLVHGNSE